MKAGKLLIVASALVLIYPYEVQRGFVIKFIIKIKACAYLGLWIWNMIIQLYINCLQIYVAKIYCNSIMIARNINANIVL